MSKYIGMQTYLKSDRLFDEAATNVNVQGTEKINIIEYEPNCYYSM